MNIDPSDAKDDPEGASEREDEKKIDDQPPEMPDDNRSEHRRSERGSKRKQRENDSTEKRSLKAQNPGTSAAAEEKGDSSSPWGPDGELDYDGFILRPVNYPKAPENSTQFIIDDHNESHMYMSFERNSFTYNDPRWGDIREAEIQDAAFIDIDYEYIPKESPSSFFNSQEFEEEYEKIRSERVVKLGRRKIIDQIDKLEEKLRDINDTIVKENPNPVLEELHVELVSLQEKNSELKSEHQRLLVVAEEKGLAIPSSSAFSSCSSSDLSLGKQRIASADWDEETGASDPFLESDDSDSSSPDEDYCTLPAMWEVPSSSTQPDTEWDDALSPERSPYRDEETEAEPLKPIDLFSGPSPDGHFSPRQEPNIEDMRPDSNVSDIAYSPVRNSPCDEEMDCQVPIRKSVEPDVMSDAEDSHKVIRTPSRVFNEDDLDTENCHAIVKRSPCSSLKSPERPLLDSSNSIANESPVYNNDMLCQDNEKLGDVAVNDEHIVTA